MAATAPSAATKGRAQHLPRRDKGAVAIHPDAYDPPGSVGAEARLDILDDVVPWLILAHDADGERGSCLGKGDGASVGLLVPSNRYRRVPKTHPSLEGLRREGITATAGADERYLSLRCGSRLD